MLAAFLGGWEILLLLAVAGAIGGLFVITLIVVLVVHLRKLRNSKKPDLHQVASMQSTGQ